MDNLIANINRNNIYPPPEIDEVLNFFNSKPTRDHNRCHAYMILRYSVAKECKRIREFNAILIGQATNHLWNTSTSQEKKGKTYRFLFGRMEITASAINQIIVHEYKSSFKLIL
ncbi:hypothetical protein Glove_267g76 [Diversispora epigaea]|uniref:Uncharacterized protein n=1 Tax=Diversispora epigaea TaxID=1348612 RepID=A0A397ICB2_9GLOM|nr:hypothetical protein Glove_267g76 [Diversispora epigaea]